MFKNGILTRKTKALLMLIILIIYIFISILVPIKSYAVQSIEAYSADKINNYPGYKSLIDNLKAKHPNWQFKILYTGLDWNQVIKNETSASHGRNLVSSDKSGAWVCATCGDKGYDTGKWKCASETAVSYYMDPRNWIYEDYIFQFEELAYDASTQTLDGVSRILSSAGWANGSTITYTKTDGSQGVINKSYAQVILEAGRDNNISPYHLASRIVQEQGKNSTLSSTGRGNYDGYYGLYNFCNISATGSGTAQVISNALTYARNKGWTDPESSIKGGAAFIAKSYINVGQSSLYLQKYDVDNSDGKLFYHQYMANASAAVSESSSVRNSYSSLGMINNSFTFTIPVYENMPDTVCKSPDSSTIVTQNVESTGFNVQVRSSPAGTSISSLNLGESILRIECAASQVNGYYWDKVVLRSGEKGYVARNYLKQVGDITNCDIPAFVNGTGVRLRNGPGTSGTTVVMTVVNGQAVHIIEKDAYNGLDGYNWVRVRLENGTQGYLASQYLTEGSSGNGGTSNYLIATVTCSSGYVNLRSQPTTSSSAVGTRGLAKGTTVTVLQENVANSDGYTWDKIVTSDGLEGYIANKYLDKGNKSEPAKVDQSPVENSVRGDLSGDGVVDADDIFNMVKSLQTKGFFDKKYDLTSDGLVDSDDIFELIKILKSR